MAEETPRNTPDPCSDQGHFIPFTVVPSNIYFPPPHDREITVSLILFNRGLLPVAYKFKTTAPKRYAIKLSRGICQPESKVEILITFINQACKQCKNKKDKFQIHAIVLKKRMNPDKVWLFTPKTDIMKLKVNAYLTYSHEPLEFNSELFQNPGPSAADKDDAAAHLDPLALSEDDHLIKSVVEGPPPRKEDEGEDGVATRTMASFENYICPVASTSRATITHKDLTSLSHMTWLIVAFSFLCGLFLGLNL